MDVEMTPTPHDLAACFVEMNDEEQADFFISVVHLMKQWGDLRRHTQTSYIGGHLRTCECSNDDTRDFLRDLADEANLGRDCNCRACAR